MKKNAYTFSCACGVIADIAAQFRSVYWIGRMVGKNSLQAGAD